MNKIYCCTQIGIDGKLVEVEASFISGLPSFNITGLANNSIQEAKNRVQSALVSLNNNGEKFKFPTSKININISPSDIPKTGSHFDLSIALLIAAHTYKLNIGQFFAFGELGLDGNVKGSASIYPLILSVISKIPDAKILLPADTKKYFHILKDLNIYYVGNLNEALEFLIDDNKNSTEKSPKKDILLSSDSGTTNLNPILDNDFASINIDNLIYYFEEKFDLDYKNIRGQKVPIRASLIAASGFHNIIFEGSPGTGKSMIAKRMRYILPPLSALEIIENAKISALDFDEIKYTCLRPFRNPHQSASKSSVLGSVHQVLARPGEIALANNGILFFDELPHFPKIILEALREPLENGKLIVSRVAHKIEYDTSFLFVGALNPCPCGNLNSLNKICRCNENEIKKYKNRLSEPFLDRIDLYVKMSEKDSLNEECSTTSKELFQSVLKAFKAQKQRGQKNLNGKLNEDEINQFCLLNNEAKDLLILAASKLDLSNRSADKLRKVARTIADLDDSELIEKRHILEAISYRYF